MTDLDETTIVFVAHLDMELEKLTGRPGDRTKVLDDITLQLLEGETLGIVGESGSGKSVLLKAIVGLVPVNSGAVYFETPPEFMYRAVKIEKEYVQGAKPVNGSVSHAVENISPELSDLRSRFSIIGKSLRKTRKSRKEIYFVFQGSRTAIDPKKTVWDTIAESFKRGTDLNKSEIDLRIKEVAEAAGLRETDLQKYPNDMNVEELQIVNIARALAVEPKLAILDEPTSDMDISAKAQILNTLRDYQYSRGMSYIVASNDLNVIRVLSDRVAVMYLGKIVEYSTLSNIYSGMLHPYTKKLISNSITLENGKGLIDGQIGDRSPVIPSIPAGCAFHTRCPVAFRNCGWTAAEVAPLIREIMILNKNTDLSNFPPYHEIIPDPETNSIKMTFEGGTHISYEFVEELNRLIEARVLLEGGTPLQAVESVVVSPAGDFVTVQMLKPRVPKLMEVRPGHFASCFQYGGLDEPQEKLPEEAEKETNEVEAT
jgi:oligopeptide/dipeptide ABC transporter ATP-binding protein